MSGWIKLWRKLLENEVLQHETRLALFIRLLLKASLSPGDVWFKGKARSLMRGQCWISERDESEVLHCDRQKIRTALAVLQNASMITRFVTQQATLITITNFGTYQEYEEIANPPSNPQSNPELTHLKPTEQEEKKVRRDNLDSDSATLRAAFRDFWDRYPRKIGGKQAAEARFFAKAKAVGPETILAGLARQVDHWRGNGTETRFIPHPSTWLTQGRWADDLSTDKQAGQLNGSTASHRQEPEDFKEKLLRKMRERREHDRAD